MRHAGNTLVATAIALTLCILSSFAHAASTTAECTPQRCPEMWVVPPLMNSPGDLTYVVPGSGGSITVMPASDPLHAICDQIASEAVTLWRRSLHQAWLDLECEKHQ